MFDSISAAFFIDKIVDYFDSQKELPVFWKQLFSWLGDVAIPLLVIGFLIILLRIVTGAIKSRTYALHIQKRLAYKLHNELNHKLRNEIVKLDAVGHTVENYNHKNEKAAINELYHHELERMYQNLQDCVDSLSEYISEYRGDTISVCIKLFESRDKNRENFDDAVVITVARSSNTREERKKEDERSSIGRNTDFHNLCTGRIVFFGSSNLVKLSESGQYESDSENWNKVAPSYFSTIVTPIRYYNNENNTIKIDVIGFICIDSENEIKEWENPDSFELQMMATYSDMLYIYLNEFYSCFK